MRSNGYRLRRAGRKLAVVRSGLRSDPKTWTDERHKDGLAGEEQAIAYLKTKGWHVVAHRFRVGRAELDLVARRGRLVALPALQGWESGCGTAHRCESLDR